jgi:predicted naringenin-chalcone synthase
MDKVGLLSLATAVPPYIVEQGEAKAKARELFGGRKELFDRLAAAKKEVGEAPIALERLQALVKAQVQKFGADGATVAFRVDTKDGKVSLTVKPEKD